MATSDPTWGELAMEGRFGVFGLWVGGAAGAGGLRRLAVGCRGLDGESAGGLRGSSLHSQGSSGEDWAFALCARGCGVRFLCSFRLDPLTLGGSWVGGAAGAGDEEGEVALGCCGLDGVSAGGLCGSSLHSQGNSGG